MVQYTLVVHLTPNSLYLPLPCPIVKLLSRVRLFATPQTVAFQIPPSMGFSRQEYWSGLPFSSPAYLPDSGIEPGSPALQADALTSEPPGKPPAPYHPPKPVNTRFFSMSVSLIFLCHIH